MLKKLLTGVVAAGAMAVPLAAVAGADPTPAPNPPAVPGTNAENPANPPAAPQANGAPGAPGTNAQSPVCVVSANTPAQGTPAQGMPAQGTPASTTTNWRQVATLQGSMASDLGLPAGQPMKVFCAPAGSQNPAQNSQGQPAGLQTPGQPNPPLNQPGQPAPQNPMPGQ
jgi:hypothetical protein